MLRFGCAMVKSNIFYTFYEVEDAECYGVYKRKILCTECGFMYV